MLPSWLQTAVHKNSACSPTGSANATLAAKFRRIWHFHAPSAIFHEPVYEIFSQSAVQRLEYGFFVDWKLKYLRKLLNSLACLAKLHVFEFCLNFAFPNGRQTAKQHVMEVFFLFGNLSSFSVYTYGHWHFAYWHEQFYRFVDNWGFPYSFMGRSPPSSTQYSL